MKIEVIEKNLEEIKNLLRKKKDVPFNFVQVAQYLSISHSQLYKYTSQRKIPFHKPAGKYLYFSKDELDEWICRNDECRMMNEELGLKNEELGLKNVDCRLSNDERRTEVSSQFY